MCRQQQKSLPQGQRRRAKREHAGRQQAHRLQQPLLAGLRRVSAIAAAPQPETWTSAHALARQRVDAQAQRARRDPAVQRRPQSPEALRALAQTRRRRRRQRRRLHTVNRYGSATAEVATQQRLARRHAPQLQERLTRRHPQAQPQSVPPLKTARLAHLAKCQRRNLGAGSACTHELTSQCDDAYTSPRAPPSIRRCRRPKRLRKRPRGAGAHDAANVAEHGGARRERTARE